MTYAPRPVFLALAVAGVASFGVATRGMAQTDLPKSSPFLSMSGPAVAGAAVEAIEFAAVRTIGPRTEIDLYNTQLKKNHWIPLGGSADGMSVLSYDARHDQVIAKIEGVNKTLRLRQPKGVAAGTAAVTMQPAMSFATPAPADTTFVQPLQPSSPGVTLAPATTAAPTSAPAAAPTTPAPTPAQPAVPLTIARQEEEARMLVSDLLEIGMAQRKAYEEKQRQGANPTPTPAAPASDATPPAQNPNGPPSGG